MRIQKKYDLRAARMRSSAKLIFIPPSRHQKTGFSRITFFTAEPASCKDLDFCCQTDEKFFGTNFFRVGHLSPEIYGVKKWPFLTHQFSNAPAAFLAKRILLILVPFDQASFNLKSSHWKFFDPGPPWPAMTRQTRRFSKKAIFLGFSGYKSKASAQIFYFYCRIRENSSLAFKWCQVCQYRTGLRRVITR